MQLQSIYCKSSALLKNKHSVSLKLAKISTNREISHHFLVLNAALYLLSVYHINQKYNFSKILISSSNRQTSDTAQHQIEKIKVERYILSVITSQTKQ